MKANPQKAFLFLALGLLCLGLALPAAAQPVPGGNYEDSCTNITLRGNVLSAMCRRADGVSVYTEMRNPQNCTGNIANNNGNLTCEAARNLPSGNYQNSCYNMYVSGNDLLAICARADGTYVQARLRNFNNCRSNISNNNGSLICDPAPVPQPPAPSISLPIGSYQDSCTSISMQGNTLIAMCRQINGNYVRSELRNAPHCRGQITNENGVLTCSAAPAPTPPPSPVVRPQGNYESTCRDITIRNNQITATCRRANGAWITTSTYYSPSSFISNCDGTLLDARTCPGTAQPQQPPRDPLEQLVQDSINSIFNNIFQQR